MMILDGNSKMLHLFFNMSCKKKIIHENEYKAICYDMNKHM